MKVFYKKVIIHLFYVLFSFILIYSCSKEASEDIGIDLVQPEPVIPVVKYQLSVTAGEGGSVSTTGGEFTSGSPITVTATPNSGYSFVNWTGDGTSTNASFTFNILANTNLTANFQLIINSYNLVLTAGDGGTVSSEGGEYEEGSEITFSAIPDDGFEFVEWSDGNTEIERTITLGGDTNLSALFQPSTKEMNISLEGIGKLILLEQPGSSYWDKVIIIDNTENITSTYTLTLNPGRSYILYITYEPFQNKLSYDTISSDYFGIYNSGHLRIFGEESFLFSYSDFPESINLKVEDVSIWLNEDVGGTLSTYNYNSIDFMSIVPRMDGVYGLVNCLKRLDASDGNIIRQGCFYGDYGPAGYTWVVSQFKWWDWGLLVYSFMDKFAERHAKFEYFEGDSFTKKFGRTYSDISYIHPTPYGKKPVLYKSGDGTGLKSSIANYLGVELDQVKVGLGALQNNSSNYFSLAEIQKSELTSSGQLVSRDRYLIQYKTFNMIPQSEIQNASLLGEAEGQVGLAFALSDVFVMYDWLQLGDLKFKYRDYNTSSNLTDFNGIERNYSLPNDLGILFKTWPGSDPNKLFVLSAKLQDLSVYYYLHQLTSGEVTYSKIIHKEPRSNYPNGNVYRGILKKFDIYSSLDNSVILTSPFNKTVKLPIN